MTIQQAIRKATENGYKFSNINMFESSDSHYAYNVWYFEKDFDYLIPEIFLDPLFWQSLGKSLGWLANCSVCGSRNEKDCPGFDGGDLVDTWLWQWHKFIDHLASGKTAEDYFKSL